METNFKIITASFLSAVVVALLGLFSTLVPSEKMWWFIAGVIVFVFSAGIVAYILDITAAGHSQTHLTSLKKECEVTLSHAKEHLKIVEDSCSETLRHVRNEYTSSILRGAIIHDSELDTLERSPETEEIWVCTPLNLDHDVPGKVFFNSLKENLDTRNVSYTYIIQDSDHARYNAREIAAVACLI